MGKAGEGCARVRGEDPRRTCTGTKRVSHGDGVAGQLLKACAEPLVAHIHPDDQPQPGQTRVGKQELGYLGFRNFSCGLWLNVLSYTHDLLLLFERICSLLTPNVRLPDAFLSFRSFTQSIGCCYHSQITVRIGIVTKKSQTSIAPLCYPHKNLVTFLDWLYSISVILARNQLNSPDAKGNHTSITDTPGTLTTPSQCPLASLGRGAAFRFGCRGCVLQEG